MADFRTQSTLDIVVDDASLRSARQRVEEEIGDVTVEVEASTSGSNQIQQVTDRRSRENAMSRQLLSGQNDRLTSIDDGVVANLDLNETRNDLLREILEATDKITSSDSSGGDGNLLRTMGGLGGGIAGGGLLAAGALSAILSGFEWPELPEVNIPEPEWLPIRIPEPDWLPEDDGTPTENPGEDPTESPGDDPNENPGEQPGDDPNKNPGEEPDTPPTLPPDPKDTPEGPKRPPEPIPTGPSSPSGTPTPDETPAPDSPGSPMPEIPLPDDIHMPSGEEVIGAGIAGISIGALGKKIGSQAGRGASAATPVMTGGMMADMMKGMSDLTGGEFDRDQVRTTTIFDEEDPVRQNVEDALGANNDPAFERAESDRERRQRTASTRQPQFEQAGRNEAAENRRSSGRTDITVEQNVEIQDLSRLQRDVDRKMQELRRDLERQMAGGSDQVPGSLLSRR